MLEKCTELKAEPTIPQMEKVNNRADQLIHCHDFGLLHALKSVGDIKPSKKDKQSQKNVENKDSQRYYVNERSKIEKGENTDS